jgi:quercetin dioxygenase-like cupin family protein
MNTRTLACCSAIAALAAVAHAGAQSPAKKAAAAHVMVTPSEVKWGPAPPVFPAGAQLAVVDGDPFKPGPYAVRLKMPDGYRIAPHWHPADENIVVLQGRFTAGLGDKFDEGAMHDLPAGSFAKMPKEVHHYAGAHGETIVQVYGQGPFALTYVNPADDPSRKTTTR